MSDLIDFVFSKKVPLVAALCASYLARRYAAGGVCNINDRLDGKTVLVTGASSGIGRETAKELGRRGARVILATDDILQGEEVASEMISETGARDLVIHRVDLGSFDSVRKFANRVLSQESRLDILINNAGVYSPQEKTENGYEKNFQVNFLGHFLLTNLLLDLLKRSAPSRVITVSSDAYQYGKIDFSDLNFHTRKFDTYQAYSQSKLANVLYTRELARRLANSGVVCMSLHPGAVRTNIFHKLSFPVYLFLNFIFLLIGKSAKQGAQTSIHCALMQPTREMMEGQALYFKDCHIQELAPNALDDELARQLWERSWDMVGLS